MKYWPFFKSHLVYFSPQHYSFHVKIFNLDFFLTSYVAQVLRHMEYSLALFLMPMQANSNISINFNSLTFLFITDYIFLCI